MLKKRVVGIILVKDGIAVQSFEFRKYLPIGRPEIVAEYFNRWGIDEIALIDISADRYERGPDFAQIKRVARRCLTPLTVGGGITKIEQIHEALRFGADRVLVNNAFLKNPHFITEASRVFGSQCIIVGIDVFGEGCADSSRAGKPEKLDIHIEGLARRAEELGAGEIFLNSVDRDGQRKGLDLAACERVCKVVSTPVIVAGGVGVPADVFDAFSRTPASAVGIGNVLGHFEQSVKAFSSHMHEKGIDVRYPNGKANSVVSLSDDGRPLPVLGAAQ